MKLTIISPRQNLIELLADNIVNSSQDFSRIWVVFPERRPGHYLRKALASRLKRSFFPPTIDSFDEFIDRLYTEFLGINDQPLEPIDAVSLLFELHSNRSGPTGSQAFLTFDEFFPLGLKLYQDLEELKTGRVTREKFLMIDSLVGQTIPEQTMARLQKLSFFYEHFYARLERENLSTRASRLEKVIEKISPEVFDRFDQIILAGFYLLTTGEIQLLKKVLESEKSHLYLIDGPAIEEIIKKLNLTISETEKPETEPKNQPEIEFYLSPDSHGQLFVLNSLISKKIENPSLLNEKQVIVLPAAETLIPLHQQTLSALPDNTYNISLGYPLTRTPLYSFFDCLFNLIQTSDEEGRVYAPDYLNFVLHPYTKNIYFPGPVRRAELTRILFHLVETIFTEKKGKLFWSLDEIVSEPELHRHLAKYTAENSELPEVPDFLRHLTSIHQKTILPFLEIKSIRDFADKLIGLLDYLDTNSTASLHLFFQPYAEAFFQQFEHLRNSLIGKQSFQNRSSYFNLFRKLISEARVPFPGTPLRGLQVLGFWETRCLNFEEVYLLDMNEDVIPGTGKVDSLLPYYLRKALGLPTYEDLEKRIEYYLNLLVAAAKKVCFFFVENSQKEKSRYVEKFLWERQKKENQPEASKFIKSVSYRIALSSPEISPIHKTEKVIKLLESIEFTASKLDTYLNCPLQFYYSSVLRLSEKEELSETMEKADIGTLVHSILKDYFEPYLAKKLPEQPDLSRLNSLIEEKFKTNFCYPLSGSFFLMKEQISRHLLEFLTDYQQRLVKTLKKVNLDLTIVGLERKFQINYQAGDKFLRLAGLIDRIERRGDWLCILDYKTSSNEKSFWIDFNKLQLEDRSTWPEAIRSLQLPFYQLLASFELKCPAEEIYSAVLLLGKNHIDESIEFSPLAEKRGKKQKEKDSSRAIFPIKETEETGEEGKEKFLLIKQIIDKLLLEIIDPTIPFSPELARKDSCSYCPFTDFCSK